jgi:hypothetical protein
LRKFRTSLLKVGGETRFTTEDASQTALVGEQHYNGRVGAVGDKNLPPSGETNVEIEQNSGYGGLLSLFS